MSDWPSVAEVEDGTASVPGFRFRLDTNTGIYRPADDTMDFVTGGVAQWRMDDTGQFHPLAGNVAPNIGSAGSEINDLHIDGQLIGALTEAASWTPALTALTTNPTLGTGSSRTGRYFKFGKLVFYWGLIKWGTAATNAGSGQYRVSLPFTTDGFHESRESLGTISIRCAGTDRTGTHKWTTGTTANLHPGDGTVVATQAAPGAWTANDEIYYEGKLIAAA